MTGKYIHFTKSNAPEGLTFPAPREVPVMMDHISQ